MKLSIVQNKPYWSDVRKTPITKGGKTNKDTTSIKTILGKE